MIFFLVHKVWILNIMIFAICAICSCVLWLARQHSLWWQSSTCLFGTRVCASILFRWVHPSPSFPSYCTSSTPLCALHCLFSAFLGRPYFLLPLAVWKPKGGGPFQTPGLPFGSHLLPFPGLPDNMHAHLHLLIMWAGYTRWLNTIDCHYVLLPSHPRHAISLLRDTSDIPLGIMGTVGHLRYGSRMHGGRYLSGPDRWRQTLIGWGHKTLACPALHLLDLWGTITLSVDSLGKCHLLQLCELLSLALWDFDLWNKPLLIFFLLITVLGCSCLHLLGWPLAHSPVS